MHTSTNVTSHTGRLKRDSKKLVSSAANDTRQDELLGSRLLWSALALALLFHGGLLFSQSFVRTYDALIHIFFGAHYAEHWFDPWEPRWYTGFFTISYPPLSHQLIALVSKILDLKTAFVIVQLAARSRAWD